MFRPFARVLFMILLLCFSIGCARQTGARSQVVFMYQAPADPFNFNKPIGVGHTLELYVHDIEHDRPVTIQRVKSLSPDVLSVEGHVAHMFGVKAHKPGRARLVVWFEDEDGQVKRDSVVMRASDVDRVALSHPCGTDDRGRAPLYLRGARDLFVPWFRQDANHEIIIGYGQFPVEVSPEGAASIRTNRTDGGGLSLDIEDVSAFTLRPKQGPPLRFETTTLDRIDTVTLDDWDKNAWMVAGMNTYVWPQPTVRGRGICTEEIRFEAKSLTPDVCMARAESDFGLVMLRGKSWGICRYEISFPGTKASGVFTARVGKLPEHNGEAEPKTRSSDDAPTRPWWFAPLLALLAPLLLAPFFLRLLRRKR